MSAQIGFHDLTSDGLVLTAQQKRFYEKEGYLVVKKVVPPHDIHKFTNRFKEICQMKDVPATMTVMRDMTINRSEYVPGEKAIMKVQDFGDDPVLFDFCQHSAIVAIVRDLIGNRTSNLLAMHTMLINKPPDTGSQLSRHPMHQDQQYFPFGPADGIVCAWTAMEKINRANGCLVVVPGTHKGPLHPHEYPKWEGGVNPLYHGIQNYDPSMPRLHLEMETGDTVFFHPVLIHGSGTNRTTGFRKAISCHYANDDICRYQPLTQGQNNTATEIVETAQKVLKKYGLNEEDVREAIPDLEGVWRLKAKAVSGVRNHL
jgi:phytanoyl-CoA hydroxylase